MSRTITIKCDFCSGDFSKERSKVLGFEMVVLGKETSSNEIKNVNIESANQHICRKCLRAFSEFYTDITQTKEYT